MWDRVQSVTVCETVLFNAMIWVRINGNRNEWTEKFGGWLNVGNLCIGYNGQNCSGFRAEIGDCLKSTPFTADDRTSTNDIYCTKINQVPRKLKESWLQLYTHFIFQLIIKTLPGSEIDSYRDITIRLHLLLVEVLIWPNHDWVGTSSHSHQSIQLRWTHAHPHFNLINFFVQTTTY